MSDTLPTGQPPAVIAERLLALWRMWRSKPDRFELEAAYTGAYLDLEAELGVSFVNDQDALATAKRILS